MGLCFLGRRKSLRCVRADAAGRTGHDGRAATSERPWREQQRGRPPREHVRAELVRQTERSPTCHAKSALDPHSLLSSEWPPPNPLKFGTQFDNFRRDCLRVRADFQKTTQHHADNVTHESTEECPGCWKCRASSAMGQMTPSWIPHDQDYSQTGRRSPPECGTWNH